VSLSTTGQFRNGTTAGIYLSGITNPFISFHLIPGKIFLQMRFASEPRSQPQVEGLEIAIGTANRFVRYFSEKQSGQGPRKTGICDNFNLKMTENTRRTRRGPVTCRPTVRIPEGGPTASARVKMISKREKKTPSNLCAPCYGSENWGRATQEECNDQSSAYLGRQIVGSTFAQPR
jgi:hypothetical protein